MNDIHPPSAMPPPRVMHLTSSLGGGGTIDQCVKLVQGLHRDGQPVWLAGPEGQPFSQVVRQLKLPFLPIGDEGPLKINFILQAARLIHQYKIQIVHGHQGRDLWPTVVAAWLSGRRPKIVLTRHIAKSPSSWFSRLFLLGQCDALIAVSEFVARVLRDGVYEPDSPVTERRSRAPLCGDHSKIHVIHGGIDMERFRPMDATTLRTEWGLQPGEFAFAVAGGYDLPRGKGQREFLLAAARVQQQLPHARFLIIGSGSLAEMLRADIQRLGLTGKAWLTPYCHDMPTAMNAIDCLVHPQVGTEAFGLVLLEAFACGRPVIASALDGIPEAFAGGNHGELVVPDSVDDLADAMVRWANQPVLDEKQRAALWERVARDFSLPAATQRVIELYELLMKAAPNS